MVAVLTLRVYTSTAAGTESSAVGGIDLISADNALNTLANRQTNPITVNTNSYEKWMKLKVDTAPDNSVTNFLAWGDDTIDTSTTLDITGDYVTGITPVATTSVVADTTFVNFTSGAKLVWDADEYTATNDTTDYMVFQLQVDADADPGNWTQETVSYSYDET